MLEGSRVAKIWAENTLCSTSTSAVISNSSTGRCAKLKKGWQKMGPIRGTIYHRKRYIPTIHNSCICVASHATPSTHIHDERKKGEASPNFPLRGLKSCRCLLWMQTHLLWNSLRGLYDVGGAHQVRSRRQNNFGPFWDPDNYLCNTRWNFGAYLCE